MKPPSPGRRTAAAKTWRQVLRAFYSRPLAWGAAISVSATLSYVGGAIMFWLHAIYRGEQGPAIDHWQHWLLDSTLGFIALTPLVLLLLPTVLWVMGSHGRTHRGIRVGLYVAAVGTVFALVTGPGPLLHNTIAGAGTPLANAATDVFGYDPDIARQHAHAPERSVFTEGVLQVAVGVPAYSLLTLISVLIVRRVVRRGRAQAEADDERASFSSSVAR